MLTCPNLLFQLGYLPWTRIYLPKCLHDISPGGLTPISNKPSPNRVHFYPPHPSIIPKLLILQVISLSFLFLRLKFMESALLPLFLSLFLSPFTQSLHTSLSLHTINSKSLGLFLWNICSIWPLLNNSTPTILGLSLSCLLWMIAVNPMWPLCLPPLLPWSIIHIIGERIHSNWS